MSKRAAAAEARVRKIEKYAGDIANLIDRFKRDPFRVDYSEELEELKRKNPADRGLILIAEREAYRREGEKSK